jgi:hypothetical protein
MVDNITFFGLDVSKRTISVAIAPGDPREAVVYFGTIEHTPEALRRLCKRLSSGAHLTEDSRKQDVPQKLTAHKAKPLI